MAASGPVLKDIPNFTNVQPQMLIGEKEDPLGPLKRPRNHSGRVAAGADDAAMLATETFKICC